MNSRSVALQHGIMRHAAFVLRHALTEFRLRYAGSSGGMAWHVVNIVLPIAIFGFVFSELMPVNYDGVTGKLGFTLYLCSGLLPWSSFSEGVLRGANSFQHYAAYMRKLDVPQGVFVASAVTGPFITLVIGMVLLLLVAWAAGLPPAASWAMLPLPILLLWSFTLGLGLLLAPINTLHRDVALTVQVFLQFGFWLVPIVYVADVVPDELRVAFMLHPFFPFLELVRALFLEARVPTLAQWGTAIAWSVAVLVLGGAVARALRSDVRDVL